MWIEGLKIFFEQSLPMTRRDARYIQDGLFAKNEKNKQKIGIILWAVQIVENAKGKNNHTVRRSVGERAGARVGEDEEGNAVRRGK